MNQSISFTLEQEFNLKLFDAQVQKLTLDQSKEFLIELNRHMMIKENFYKDLLKHYMGIGNIETL